MFVIGTAGHVDHGKSTLVKTLTGIDPDRLAEEQRREMTIDLGFAWLTTPGGQRVSIVDVPGHERFIKNMLAGIGGVDAALLVVAADESIMPQTAEHLTILDLLEVRHGVVALTKADLVDDEWLMLVTDDIRTRLHGHTLAGATIVPVSARTGAGLPALLTAIDTLLLKLPGRAAAQGAPRLSIDRAFTIGGFGAVVTGTLQDGPLHVGDEIEIVPRGLRARVRGLQIHRLKVEHALPGTRVAVNLAGISHHELARGDVLTPPGALHPTVIIDVRLRIPTEAAALEHNTPLDLFVGAAVVPCRAALLDSDRLAPGDEGWVQLRLDAPIAVARGDRLIVRRPSPGATVGGGTVIDAHPARHRRHRPEVAAALAALARGTPEDLVRQALADGQPRTFADTLRAAAIMADTGAAAIHALVAAGEIVALGAGGVGGANAVGTQHTASLQMLISATGWGILRTRCSDALAGYHRRYPLRATMPREELRARVKLDARALEAVLTAVAADGMVVAGTTGVRLATFTPAPDATQQLAVTAFLRACAATPYAPPASDLDAELLAWLVERGDLVRTTDVFFPAAAYAEMLGWVQQQLVASEGLTVAHFRDRFGTSRKYALALLEHLDERRITRRVGDARMHY